MMNPSPYSGLDRSESFSVLFGEVRSLSTMRTVEDHVMGFCTKDQHKDFLSVCPFTEEQIVKSGIILIKYWLEVSDKEQERRFEARLRDPLRQWKLNPMDLPSRSRWYEYSRARDLMLEATDTEGKSVVYPALGRQEARPSQLHQPPARADPPTRKCPGTRSRFPGRDSNWGSGLRSRGAFTSLWC